MIGRQISKTLIVMSLFSSIVFVVIYISASLDFYADTTRLIIFVVGAVTSALLLSSVQWFADFITHKINPEGHLDQQNLSKRATVEFSQAVSNVLDIETFVALVTEALTSVMSLSHSGIFMLNGTTPESVQFLYREPGSPYDKAIISLDIQTSLYQRLIQQQEAIDFQPPKAVFTGDFDENFTQLKIAACAPIIIDQWVMGLLACGTRVDGRPLVEGDLNLLYVLAQQAGVGLRNARLVADLEHLNRSMRKLNLTLKMTNEKLERMDAVKSDFVTIASHELRTPLAQVRGYTDMLASLNEQDILTRDETTQLADNLRKASERMEELIAAMLDVSKLDIDAMDLSLAGTSLETVVKMAVDPLTDAIHQRRISLIVRGLKGLPEIQADLQRMVQAFHNLIINAVKFTPDGGQIEIVADHMIDDGQHIQIKIKDSGVGIDPQHHEAIFNKFYRAYDPSLHSTGDTKFMGAGPGLGLTIARGVIEGHGGKISVESPGYDIKTCPGSTFILTLPVNIPFDARRVLSFEADTGPVSARN